MENSNQQSLHSSPLRGVYNSKTTSKRLHHKALSSVVVKPFHARIPKKMKQNLLQLPDNYSNEAFQKSRGILHKKNYFHQRNRMLSKDSSNEELPLIDPQNNALPTKFQIKKSKYRSIDLF